MYIGMSDCFDNKVLDNVAHIFLTNHVHNIQVHSYMKTYIFDLLDLPQNLKNIRLHTFLNSPIRSIHEDILLYTFYSKDFHNMVMDIHFNHYSSKHMND